MTLRQRGQSQAAHGGCMGGEEERGATWEERVGVSLYSCMLMRLETKRTHNNICLQLSDLQPAGAQAFNAHLHNADPLNSSAVTTPLRADHKQDATLLLKL
ncbi:hypothetical protein CgunFtcFv8_006906 [Champsocephalus gunnari]|uniref:Uncharacterized protein n=1 Tax=Champsocephalus gunnari TaxID=52237 RepID=A0AAN8H5D5_CHAGU|nr:hypothetical protein CgunFtcFv8_006906 [Champsocephalus gunnari]